MFKHIGEAAGKKEFIKMVFDELAEEYRKNGYKVKVDECAVYYDMYLNW